MFLLKKTGKITGIKIIFVFIAVTPLVLAGCSLSARGGSGNAAEELLPSFSDSYIEFVDINGGEIYPGDAIKIHVNIINSGDSEAKNVEVRLITHDFFKPDNSKAAWSIDILEAGEKTTFTTEMALIEDIESNTVVRCGLQVSSDKVSSFVSPDFNIQVYGAAPFEGNFIPIIGLHAIEDEIEEPIELYTAHFDELCRVLKEYGYETITFGDILDYIDSGKALPEKPVIITSDDGFQSVYTNAFPILKKYGYRMTVFLVTGAVGETENQRKVNTYFNKRTKVVRPILIWPEIKEMYEYGCEFLSHSVNHVRLGLASDEEFLYELIQSKKDIESHLGNEVLFFAWPYDSHSPSKWHLIPEAGYRGAVRYGNGIEDMRTINLYDIKRVEFNSYIPPDHYAGYLKLDRSIEIYYRIENYTPEAGEKFTVEYVIKNTGEDDAKIASMELELPENIEFVGVSPEGSISQYPGLKEGTYMWVSDSYIIGGKERVNLIVELRGAASGESTIKFRLTHKGNYVDCDDIELEIKENN